MDDVDITEVSATGDVTTDTRSLYAVSLTAAGDAATLVVRRGGSGGTVILELAAAAGTSASAPLNGAVLCPGGIHATLTGTSPSASFVHS